MKLSQVAAQLYTVTEFCQTTQALAETARKLRAIGYRAVQLSKVGPIPLGEIIAIMAGEGLTICATHEPSTVILDRPEEAIAKLQQLGCRLTAYPYPQGIDFGNPQSLASFARRLDSAGEKFRRAGLTLGYHNHDLEFVRCGEATVLDYLFAHTDPQNLVAELDTYWVQYGGGDCVEWCRKLSGRMPFIHLKDYAMTPARQPACCEIGAGNLPFQKIIAEAERSGCEWFIVEQDVCPGDPFASLRQSFDYIKARIAAS